MSHLEKEVPKLSDVEVAWVAGLFEGEGCVTLQKPSKTLINGPYKNTRRGRRLYLTLSMTDQDVIDKLYRIVQVGSVHKKGKDYYESRGYKTQWTWAVTGPLAEELMFQLLPHLGLRRRARFLDVMSEVMGINDNDDD